METMIPVVVLVVFGVPIGLAIWLIVRAVLTKGRLKELSIRLNELEAEVIRLKRERVSAKPVEPEPKPAPAPATEPPPVFTLPTREQILRKQREGSQPIETPAAQTGEAPVFASAQTGQVAPPPPVPPPLSPIE